MEDAFTYIGNTLGEFIRFLVDSLTGFFANLDDAARGFVTGLADSLGVPPTLLNLLVLLIGLGLLWKGFAALLRRALIAMLIWWLLGVTVLSWLIQ
ncbi:hypothetical protein [Halomonas cerina]|uniref:Phage shock protein PspC (Stress-responsive transcriptional regulator) n=1 Tax=Halomonas cerina TaxID=447424 RepID=A0A839V5A5_9GAMM|nr:hypothetical protein [Halomonas cerina]MBB3190863.1 phage shock protein PspC (stress-responsive transcriptional regulator) [Halomonas cerina]